MVFAGLASFSALLLLYLGCQLEHQRGSDCYYRQNVVSKAMEKQKVV